MKPFVAIYTVLMVTIISTVANAQATKSEGRLTAEITFSSIDEAGKGYIHQGDLEQFRSDVFVSMDSDDNRKITFEEFSAWDPGFSSIAEEMGRMDAFKIATKIVFSFWDRNGDGAMTESEMRFAMNADFRRADLNDDAVLIENEFLHGFMIIVAMRAALNPAK